MMSDDQILEVVQAHKEGKKIQVLAIHSDLGWQNCDSPSWDFARTNYRVAPEPRKPREWQVPVVNGSIASNHPYFVVDTTVELVRVREVIDPCE